MPKHPATGHIMRLVGALQASAKAKPVIVESEADPNVPGRTEYRIIGPSREAVQAKITELMDTVDMAFGGVEGRADFMKPVLFGVR